MTVSAAAYSGAGEGEGKRTGLWPGSERVEWGGVADSSGVWG